MIKINNLSCGYGKKEILHNVNAHLKKGEVTAILGSNGCGKTTLMKAVAGLIKTDNGMIYINDNEIHQYKAGEMAKLMAFMPQIRHVPAMTVEDLLMCARYPYLGLNKVPEKKDRDAVSEAMEITGISGYKDRYLKKLSGGERQKVYFAFMLAQQADIMLLDEPTTYLDIERQFEILDLIRVMQEKGKTVVMILHDICHSLKYADRLVVMNDGCIEAFGTPEEIVDSGVLEKIYNIKLHRVTVEDRTEYIIMK